MDRSASSGPTLWPGINRREFLRVSGLIGLAAGGSWSLTGCGLFGEEEPGGTPAEGNEGDGAPAAGSTLRMSFTTIDVLDPQVITNGMWILSRGVLEGLVSQNEEGTDVVPAVAERWDVSEDGLTYTFHLREDARWSNGDPVTADDFERTYQRLLTPSSGGTGGTTMGANSYQMTTGIKGAAEHLNGATEDWSDVGIEATGDRELVLTLAQPNPDFLLAMTHPALLPLHMDTLDEHPDDWQAPPNFLSNGPFAVERFVHNSALDLVVNEEYWDRGSVQLERIEITLVDPGANPGTATIPYENEEVDILPLEVADVLRFESDPELAEHVQAVDTYSIGYLATLRSKHPALEDVRVRKALSISLERDVLAGVIPQTRPGLSLVHDRVEGWDDRIAVQENLDEAKQLLADAGYPDGEGLPAVRILSGVDNPIVDAIVDRWQQNLGIDAVVDRVESGVYVERRWQVQEDDYIGFYWGTFAGLPTWATYVGALWSPTDIQKFSLPGDVWAEYQETEADEDLSGSEKSSRLSELISENASEGSLQMADLVAEAVVELDDDARLELFKEAARLREEEYLFFSVVWLSAFFAVRPTISGLQLRRYPDFFYLKSLGIEA
ncbi:peptide ABC transporter substrate-binding protein [Phytoactinopolyspora alkaliphila]|uniref:Peptide ABC transporter substrate-binding protein n=1 Tax=Phytoactinopolyspora alkaliphila TaxID=1783498 RepID=A0A6N9YL51_9ACTN|nr:peptide ABC transporter substrate-binding protein [Phytoactinopolyspora alkaliphila]NED95714.1 peptide ABC transporter substrate-binding protein [Phytoactinopolyspora alkaliphila]